ncbi:CD8A protein, partial [Notiomystis cincta]|nr:CD8A protein [Notiomystis cincta]
NISQLQVGQRLQLECQTDRDSGAFWIRRDRSGALHFIVFINSLARATFSGEQRANPRFEAGRDNRIYHLAVKSFTPQDEGNYFCIISINQMLYFSPGQPAFLPATTTAAPTTCGPTSKHAVTGDPNLKTPDPERRMQEELNYFCHIFLWVPLAGLCLLLLQLVAITTVLCRPKAHHCPA